MINERKIRKLLGTDYHLSVGMIWKEDRLEVANWTLFRRYNDSEMYFNPDNKPIMTSEKNTEKELLKFAKEHHKYDSNTVFAGFRVIISFIVVIVLLINVFVENSYIRTICLSIDALVLIELFISSIIIIHNTKISDEQWRDNMKMLINKMEEKCQIKKN